jgi:hypothetical protein
VDCQVVVQLYLSHQNHRAGKLRGNHPVHRRKDRQAVYYKSLEARMSGWLASSTKHAGLPGEDNLCVTNSSTLSAEGRSSGPDCKHF